MDKLLENIMIWAFALCLSLAWVSSIIVCIEAKAWGLLIAVILFAPLGIVHGVAGWLGFSWL